MQNYPHRKVLLDKFKEALEVQIKLDIAETIRHHPHLDGDASLRAYNELANPESIDRMVRDLAQEEVESAIDRGELPAAAILHLAGYKQNPIAEG